MFMRFVHLSINVQYEKTFRQFYNIVIMPQLEKMDGCRLAGLIKSNSDSGKFISISLWDKKNQAEKYEKSDVFNKLSQQINQFLAESSEWKLQLSNELKVEYTPVVQSPVKRNYAVAVNTKNVLPPSAQASGMYIRIVSIKIQPGKVKEFKNIYSHDIIPALESTMGCNFVYLIESLKHKEEFLSLSVWENKSFADDYDNSGKFNELTSKLKHTFSKFYLWKMELEQQSKSKVETSEDMKIDNYTVITGKNFS